MWRLSARLEGFGSRRPHPHLQAGFGRDFHHQRCLSTSRPSSSCCWTTGRRHHFSLIEEPRPPTLISKNVQRDLEERPWISNSRISRGGHGVQIESTAGVRRHHELMWPAMSASFCSSIDPAVAEEVCRPPSIQNPSARKATTTYHRSPWSPFPCSSMKGFLAKNEKFLTSVSRSPRYI
jgi:hypothetical protein